MLKGIKNIVVIFILAVGIVQHTYAQNNAKPKIGLALSGGGAKGFAHIGAIKALEELKIPIDYIGGTSIGSIVGGMYAIGYTPESIMQIVEKQDWDYAISDKMIRDHMPFFEKEEMDRYVISLPITKRNIEFPSYFVKGQNIMQLLTDYTIRYHSVTSFSQFPIPFLCIATDLVSGEEVVMKEGFLPECMRASMAIPAAVSAEEMNGRLLVDGGVSNVFPVDRVREMGADLVIGIDIQSGLHTKEELNDGRNLIPQLVAIISKDRYEENVKNCDYHIQPDIKGFSISSFTVTAARELYKRGYNAVMNNKDEFIRLRDSLKLVSYPVEKYKPIGKDDVFFIRKIDVKKSNAELSTYVKGKLEIQEGTFVPLYLITEGIQKLYATTNYEKVMYKLLGGKEKILEIELIEANSSYLNIGLHYNIEDQSSLLINTTLKNKIGLGSLLSMDLRLSKLPGFKFRYTLDRGAIPGVEFRYNVNSSSFDLYNQGVLAGFVKGNINNIQLNTHTILNHKFTIGAGMEMEIYDVQSFYYNAPDGENPLSLTDENFYNYQLFLKFDDRDSKYFPTSGSFLQAYGKIITNDLTTLYGGSPLLLASLKYKHSKEIFDKMTVSPGVYARLLWGDEVPPYYFSRIGGEDWVEILENQVPFYGMRLAEIQNLEVVIGRLELRYNIYKTHNIHAFFNVGGVSSDFNVLDSGYLIWGGGLGYSIDSFVGPLSFTLTSSSNSERLTNYFSLGYWF